jgi:hypothetical protein
MLATLSSQQSAAEQSSCHRQRRFGRLIAILESGMKGRAPSAKLVLATSLALATPCLWAQDGIEGALPRANPAVSFGPTLVIADFDSDGKPDGAVLVDFGGLRGQSSFRIDLHFTGRTNSTIPFESTETAHAVAAWDIDDDGDIDLIVECPFTQQRLQVWLNDGDGDFSKAVAEDFPSPVPTRERLRPPSSRFSVPLLALSPQRSSEIAMQTARRLPGPPSSTGEFEDLSTTSSPSSRGFAQNLARAPPFPHSL